MADPTETILTALRTVTGFTGGIYDGQVPAQVPTDTSGHVKPYAVLWAGPGTDLPTERTLTGLYDTGVLDWRPQLTVVGATPAICRQACDAAISVLANLPMPGGGYLRPDSDLLSQMVPTADNQVTPGRFYLPVPLYVLTTR